MDSNRSLDIVIPVYNEAPVLGRVFEHLNRSFSLPARTSRGISTVRFIFIDDGSSDDTTSLITDEIRRGSPAALLCLSRNFGHQSALAAGLDFSTADLVAVIDADLQDPPELILEMIERLKEGFDILFGQRHHRKEAFYKRLCYWAFYRLCSLLSEVSMPVDAGDFCVMKSDVVRALRSLPEKLRFQRGLRSWIGFRQSAFLYDRPGRELGVTKYTWRKLYALATDGIASLSIRPLRITQVMLFISAILTTGYISMLILLFLRSDHPGSQVLWFLTTQGLIAITSSLQLFCLYIMGAYLGRMYLEVKGRPPYIVMRTVTPESVKSS